MAIPIIKESGRYQLYEAIAMPVVHPKFPEKLFFSYRFDSPYLAIQKSGSDFFTTQPGSPGNFFTMTNRREAQCKGKSPRVCALKEAVQSPRSQESRCLYDLFSDQPTGTSCPTQVQYHDGPMFRHVGMGVWLYGAAKGTLLVRCSNQSRTSAPPHHPAGQYELTGTGMFRLQPGCEASLGSIRVPSYVNGKGQFRISLPDAPIVDLFSLNFSMSLWSNITSMLTPPVNISSFLNHLTETTDIGKDAMRLRTFNKTIQQYEALQNQLSPYHPYRWISNPQSQITGFTGLLTLNLVTVMLLSVAMWKLHRRVKDLMGSPTEAPESHRLVRSRRRRRRTMDVTV
ncbi:uncharacterized protein LOC122364160 [Amphibalanus amphitrite]|uniref:uncharacterized protein LOC122364160 n=1 Tax=Amphibalanus amphitrite TaxID=1232801 RepID=UPI001C916DF7|nr:uncharacterized protein LOC122364160 [Amphibalanus amphitrite]